MTSYYTLDKIQIPHQVLRAQASLPSPGATTPGLFPKGQPPSYRLGRAALAPPQGPALAAACKALYPAGSANSYHSGLHHVTSSENPLWPIHNTCFMVMGSFSIQVYFLHAT